MLLVRWANCTRINPQFPAFSCIILHSVLEWPVQGLLDRPDNKAFPVPDSTPASAAPQPRRWNLISRQREHICKGKDELHKAAITVEGTIVIRYLAKER